MKTAAFLLVLALSAGAVFGFGQKEPQKKEIIIGFSIPNMESAFFRVMERGVRDACTELGYTYVLVNQEGSAEKMTGDIAALVARKVAGIVVAPVDPRVMGPAVEKARKARIPVVCAELGRFGRVNAIVVSDNRRGGEMAMEQIDRMLKAKGVASKNIGIGRVASRTPTMTRPEEGFVARAGELGYTIAVDLVVDPPGSVNGYDVMQKMMYAVPDLAAAFFTNGREAYGAALALKASGLESMVLGYDADPEDIQAVSEGLEAATFAQRPYEVGYESVRVMRRIFSGEKLEDAVVPVEVSLLTPETIAAFLKSVDAEMLR